MYFSLSPGYTVKGKTFERTLTLDEVAKALSMCRNHFGLGPKGGKAKSTLSRVRRAKERSAPESEAAKTKERHRVKASKDKIRKAKQAQQAEKKPVTSWHIERRTRADLMNRAERLDVPQWLRYEVIRKAEEKCNLGLVLALVEQFEAQQPSLKDPAAWLHRRLRDLREPSPQPVARPWGTMSCRDECMLSARDSGDGAQ